MLQYLFLCRNRNFVDAIHGGLDERAYGVDTNLKVGGGDVGSVADEKGERVGGSNERLLIVRPHLDVIGKRELVQRFGRLLNLWL